MTFISADYAESSQWQYVGIGDPQTTLTPRVSATSYVTTWWQNPKSEIPRM